MVSTKNTDKRSLAYEISAQAALNFPRLLLPFKTWKLIPKRYSPTTSITLGTSVQDNIGLGRIGFNAGLNYFANVNDVVSHRLSPVSYTHLDVYKRQFSSSCESAGPSPPKTLHARISFDPPLK